MPIQNSDVAEIFNRVADILDIQGENRFRAYRNAVRFSCPKGGISGLGSFDRIRADFGGKFSRNQIE